ncbi:cytochrome c-type biogenesis protein [Desulfosporosinus hippei DSM 8344]|uniref:Cytochrome c-type biogenesis protein n=1 Tax=Desulfosporosinus hippei DSM 8344 TaxID=1121419 RepID=A0A1G7VPM3_9FIRM|nr:cytochrome c-type biogenesis protein [Desulfosporosinus hippei DSM 8344]
MVLALEKEYRDKVNFIVVDIDDPQGQALARQFDIYYIPAFFVLDQQGQITYSASGPQSKSVLDNALNSGNPNSAWYESFFNDTLPRVLSNGGVTILLFVFLGGLMTSLSPCILSMLPVMLGYIGGLEKPSKTKGFITSTSFVLGLAATFALLGIAASLLGKVFGQIGSAWLYIIALFAIIMGLQLIGVVNINLPGLQAMPEKKGGVLGSFGVGLLFGLVASPCATPVLAVLMTYVAGQGVLWYGGLLLFIYGLGHGLPLIIAGTFTAVLKSLPRLQRWSHYITLLSGGLLIVLGLYFFTRTG